MSGEVPFNPEDAMSKSDQENAAGGRRPGEVFTAVGSKQTEPHSDRSYYKGMEDDPIYEGKRMKRFKDNAFGYDTAILGENDEIVTIGSSERGGRPEFDKGARVTTKGDYRALGGLEPGQPGTIVKFREPFDDKGSTDHIVLVEQNGRKAWLKPTQLEPKYF